jgi:hypothetical protein
MCEEGTILNCSIKEFKEYSLNLFKNIYCKKCNNNKFIRIYSSISSKISRSSYEIVEIAKEDARKTIENIKNGDQHAIRDIYGEG